MRRTVGVGRAIGGSTSTSASASARRGARRPRTVTAVAAAGFTLIEVLLATVLLASGLALAFATLRASTATVERGETLAARSERMRAVEGFLRRRLASAVPMGFATDPQTGDVLRFIGEPDRMQFVADLPNYLGQGGPHLHDLMVLDDGGQASLAVAFSIIAAGEAVEEASPRPPERLVPDLTALRFRYRGIDDEGVLGDWAERWEAVDQLPLQVLIALASGSGGAWPELVVALPQSTGGAGSAVVPGSGVGRDRIRQGKVLRGRGNLLPPPRAGSNDRVGRGRQRLDDRR